MGEGALVDTGYYLNDGNWHDNNFGGKWTGKNGVNSEQDFLNNHVAQEDAVRSLAEQNWRSIQNHGFDDYVGQTVNGTYITVEGLLAGAHLLGTGKHGLADFFEFGLDSTDGNNVHLSEYMFTFNDVEIQIPYAEIPSIDDTIVIPPEAFIPPVIDLPTYEPPPSIALPPEPEPIYPPFVDPVNPYPDIPFPDLPGIDWDFGGGW